MRYLFVTSGSLEFNSSFMRLRELGRHIAAEGLDVHYVVDDGPFNASLVDVLDFSSVHLIRGVGRIGRLIARRSTLERVNPDVTHILNPQPSNTATTFGTNRFTVVDWDELLSARRMTWGMSTISRACESYGRRRSQLTVVSSRYMQHIFKVRFGLDSLYLPYATYVEPFPPSPSPFAKPAVVYLGNFHHDGDFDILLDAWEILGTHHDVPDLHMIGGGERLASVKRFVESSGMTNVRVHGYLPWPDVWAHLENANFLIFPIRDTVGNRMRCPAKVFAYMQAQRPIITNPVGEVAEALGGNAIYVDSTPNAFAAAVRKLSKTRLPGLNHDLNRFRWSSRAQELLEAVHDRIDSRD
jgi:glycosyltransferase involved in cell wall biosynthesis